MGEPASPTGILALWRERGAERFDPVRFRFLEALARRAESLEGKAGRLVEKRLAEALAEYDQRLARAREEAGKTIARLRERFPDAADQLTGMYEAGDFRGLGLLAVSLESRSSPTGLAVLAGHGPGSLPQVAGAPAPVEARAESPAELKSIRYFRETWSRLSVDQQLTQALAQVPENAGPLNSQLLILQALKQMRDISPAYLQRFMSYVDALLWLEQAGAGSPPAAKAAPRGEGEKKRRSGRAKAG